MNARADKSDANVVARDAADDVQSVRDALRNLQYGTVTVIVQDGVIVQIDRTEKMRIRQRSAKSDS